MPLNFNGNIPDLIKFNGNDVLHLKYNGVEVWTKNTNPETWMLADALSDTIHDTCDFTHDFTSDGVIFHSLKVEVSGQVFTLKYDDITACNINTDTWTDAGYKTLYFSTPPTGQLKQWLVTNGTKSQQDNPVQESSVLYVNSAYKAIKDGETLIVE